MGDTCGSSPRVLIVHTWGGLGDLISTSPLAEALKQRFPDADVTVWASATHASVLQDHPYIDRTWTASPREPVRQLLRQIREARYDLALFPWATGRQAWLIWLAAVPGRVGPTRRFGYSFLFTHRVPVRTEAGDTRSPWVDVQLDYARALGWAGTSPRPRIQLTRAEREAARAWLAGQGFSPDDVLCALHIGKGLRLDHVRWPIDRFVDIGRQLATGLGVRILLTGTANERGLAERVASGIGPPAVNLAGRTADLRLLCGVIDRCAAVVGIDSGPMHVAAALGVPVVSLFPLRSDCPPRWRPYGVDNRVVRTASWRCPLDCVKERCRDFECLLHLDVDQAVSGARELLPGGIGRLSAGTGWTR